MLWGHNASVGWPNATHLYMARQLKKLDDDMSKIVKEAMEELAGHLEDGKAVAYKTAVVNGMFTISIRMEPGNPMADRCFTIDEKWEPEKIGKEWVFKPSFFQNFSKKQAKVAEERTLRTLVAHLKKNGVDVRSIYDQPDGKFMLALTNGSNFRLDGKWKPTLRPDTNTWVFPYELFAKYGPLPGTVHERSLVAEGLPLRISRTGNPVFKEVGTGVSEKDILEMLRGHNMTLTEIHRKFSNHANANDIRLALGSLVDRGLVKFWKESTGGRPAEVYTVVEPSIRNCIPGTPDAVVFDVQTGVATIHDFKTVKPFGQVQEMAHWKGVLQPVDSDGYPLRRDPNCPAEAKFENGFRKFLERPPMTMEELSKLLGKSPKWIDNQLGKAQPEKHGYHTSDIPKGKAGEFSKITEEYHEALDAHENNNPVMLLLELADMLGAVERFLEVQHPTVTLDDVVKQAKLTNEVFRRGLRENRDPV